MLFDGQAALRVAECCVVSVGVESRQLLSFPPHGGERFEPAEAGVDVSGLGLWAVEVGVGVESGPVGPVAGERSLEHVAGGLAVLGGYVDVVRVTASGHGDIQAASVERAVGEEQGVVNGSPGNCRVAAIGATPNDANNSSS